ncbi:hypothetical protein [Hoeflea prorocentri]|uniref:Uncharacterized protein n=1 Tax=Hoeflea prorocentri TaxID=1922333 RepID=A0A9X3ZHX7_9HYPH|nr:hypothetical protein [Hoeflea prorocentri]MCY6381210.1 hypothetical protein [Hoeflea prorocentri]MDA5399010.1 hypothetical protein [Hoeflea prorocentri]
MTTAETVDYIEQELIEIQKEINSKQSRRKSRLRFNDLKRLDELRARKNRLWIRLQEALSGSS